MAPAGGQRHVAVRHLLDPARGEPLAASFGHDTGFGSQRLPGEGGMDGFFCARLRKA
jgi:hypothetical protein